VYLIIKWKCSGKDFQDQQYDNYHWLKIH
jgi:hypothetical protein